MRLPAALECAITNELAPYNSKSLTTAVEELSARYRSARKSASVEPTLVSSNLDRAAYLLTRMPATYAAVSAVLQELRGRAPELEIRSLLDLGAGPGTAMWAAAEIFPSLECVNCVERDAAFILIGRNLAGAAQPIALHEAQWIQADLRPASQYETFDLVVISYALGELANFQSQLRAAWDAAAKAIVIVEPGTPHGFQNILSARSELLTLGAQLVAPCPHESACPMALPPGLKPLSSISPYGTAEAVPFHGGASVAPNYRGNWCHFAQRLERSSLHRRSKGGELGYEDEKFSYIIAARQPTQRVAARVVRHPFMGKGHIKLELCTLEGLESATVTRSDREAFRRARKASWGEEWIDD